MLKTPVLVRSLKLRDIEPSQNLDGWPPGNTGCCRLLLLQMSELLSMSLHFYSILLSLFSSFEYPHRACTSRRKCSSTRHTLSKQLQEAATYVYGHIMLKTPVLVWSLKLSNIEPSQYLDGWPPGNTGCCRLLILQMSELLSISLHFYSILLSLFSSFEYPHRACTSRRKSSSTRH